MTRTEQFEKWYEEYFGSSRNRGSHFSYKELKEAFLSGYSEGIAKMLLGYDGD